LLSRRAHNPSHVHRFPEFLLEVHVNSPRMTISMYSEKS
jgi:hypothetical protein